MTKRELPQYEAMDPEPALEEMRKFIKQIESGEFKVVKFNGNTQNEILELPNPDGKPFTKPTGKTVKTIEITVCNQVAE